jgi:hypothetical protein
MAFAIATHAQGGGQLARAALVCSQPPCHYLPFVATRPPVHVNSVYQVPSRGGYTRAVGDIINTASYPVYDVTLAADFYAFSGYQYTVTGTTALSVTFPGQLNPYHLSWEYGRGPTNFINVRVVSWSLTSTLTYQPLTVVSTATAPFGKVFATLRNDSPYTLTDVRAVAWVGNQSSGIHAASLAGSVPPSATVMFTSTIQPASQTFQIAAQGVVSP